MHFLKVLSSPYFTRYFIYFRGFISTPNDYFQGNFQLNFEASPISFRNYDLTAPVG